ncbi:major centromere autoantigen B [Pangasianodon hypophthalmus]|uniref:major centromere autoantigen B n=1 Tax=Pangasianodon hypophthalmus TaxID=310915 RepID=UPI000EFF32CB|nr:major centromere autoantigen B [Pangasianodon hypophthalmus]
MAALKRRFTIDDKRRILELYDQLPRMSQRKAAKRLNIAPSMLWTILHNRNCIIKGEIIKRKKNKWVGCGRSPRLEANIWKWIDQCRQSGTPVTDLMIHRKSMDIAARMGIVSFRPSPRWYCGFKKREALVRERYRIYPEVDLNNQPDQLGSPNAPCSASPPADAEPPQEHSMHETRAESVTVSEPEQDEQLPVQSSPTVLVGKVNGTMQTVTVPSLQQMQEAMKTLATGLLYRGFCDFQLLHQFEKEVSNVVKRSMAQGCHDSFVA